MLILFQVEGGKKMNTRLKEFRKKKRMSQRDLARVSGESQYIQWNTNRRSAFNCEWCTLCT